MFFVFKNVSLKPFISKLLKYLQKIRHIEQLKLNEEYVEDLFEFNKYPCSRYLPAL